MEAVEGTIRKYLSAVSPSVERVELAFFGGSFTGISPDLQEMYLLWIQPYIKSGAINSIRISTRPDYINSSILSLLKRYNVETIELGVQSFDDEVLTASGRGHTSGDSVRAVKLIKGEGFRAGIQLLPGLPHDTFEKSVKSAGITVSLKPDDVRIYPAVVLKDTGLEKLYNSGEYTPLALEEAVELCAVMYSMFLENDINVIRMGLHPMDLNDTDTSVIAGPYHPAMGFMIKSRYRRGILDELFTRRQGEFISGRVTLLLPEKNREEYIGMNRRNISFLKEKYFLTEIDCRYSDISEPLIQ